MNSSATYVIETTDDFNELFNLLDSDIGSYLCLDLETDSVQEKTAKIHGVGLAISPEEAFYIPVRDKEKNVLWSQDQLQYIYSCIGIVAKKRKLIGWNLIYDVLVFQNNSGIDISETIYCDGILLKHTLAEERPHGLKEVAVKYLGPESDKAQQALYDNIKKNGGSTTKENTEMWKADMDVLAEYCCWDVILSYKLFNLFMPQLKEQGLEKFFFDEEVMPLYQVTIDMKRTGFPVDVNYFKDLNTKIKADIFRLEKEILNDLKNEIKPFEESLLAEEFPCKTTGNFPKALSRVVGCPLPEKDGKITIAKKAIEGLNDGRSFYMWLLGYENALPSAEDILKAQHLLFFEKNPDCISVFNIASNDHLGWLFFEKLGLKPLSKTEKGKPQCDDDFLSSVKEKHSFVKKLIDYKKLQKLSSTYIEGILERQIDGTIYASFLQFGTTSGRYSSTNPNLQNLPRVKDDEAGLSELVLGYVNAIKKGFIAPSGYRIVNADYSQLEPCCFAHASGDEKLREVFRRGYDLYSQIAIDVFGLTDCSADKRAKNYLKKLHPEKRQLVKVFCLAVVYGAGAGRISEVMEVDYKYAASVIEDYLDAYPELRSYMERCDAKAKRDGFVKNDFGRIRHLPVAKALYARWGDKLLDGRYTKANGLGDLRYTLKNNLNNAKNFPIQSTAASIVNRAMIRYRQEAKKRGLQTPIIAQVHDEITLLAKESEAQAAKELLKECMENTTKISVPLQAEPLIGENWAEAK
jgi:DNA polymerase I-like protein with 3'-5' exonuclease and polymerase domains